MQIIFKMHEAGLSYNEILKVIGKAKRQIELTDYTEEWMKQHNPEGLNYIK